MEVDGKKYTIHIPSGNEKVAMEKSKEDYKKVYDYLKEPGKFGHIDIRNGLTKYSFITSAVSTNDQYTIESVTGNINSTITSNKELNSCLKQMQDIEKEFSKIFNDYERFENIADHPIDSTGRSKVHLIKFVFKTGDSAQLQCFDF